LAAGFLALSATSAPAELAVGDAAPPMRAGRWVQGEAVAALAPGKVYLVEFWATWCGPCIAAIPHVNDLHKRFGERGLVVIGQNVWERDVAAVPGFIAKMGAKMSYRVALDDTTGGGRGRMAETWLTAAGRNGIPCAFVVDKLGKIAFIGHPMQIEAAFLEKLLAVPGPPEAAAAATAPAGPGPAALALARQAGEEIRAGRFDAADRSLAGLHEELADPDRYLAAALEIDLLLGRGESGDAVELARLAAEDCAGRPGPLNTLAASLVARPDAPAAARAAAGEIAGPMAEGEGDGRAAALATLARIAFLDGDAARAVDLQTRAAAAAPPAAAAAARAALEELRQGRLPAAPSPVP
jgi:thiol-disulfide isomerase/thioredoxin